MKFNRIRNLVMVSFLVCSFSLISCSDKEVNIKENVEGIKLNKGAVVENIDNTYKNLNLNEGTYEKVKENKNRNTLIFIVKLMKLLVFWIFS